MVLYQLSECANCHFVLEMLSRLKRSKEITHFSVAFTVNHTELSIYVCVSVSFCLLQERDGKRFH